MEFLQRGALSLPFCEVCSSGIDRLRERLPGMRLPGESYLWQFSISHHKYQLEAGNGEVGQVEDHRHY